MTDKIDLAQLIRDLRDSTGELDPKMLWSKVLDELPATEYRAALELTLPDFVRRVLSRTSSHEHDSVTEPSSTSTNPHPASSRASSTSSSGTSWRETAAEIMKKSVCVDGARWVALGECTAELLREAVAYKRLVASRTMTAASRYERLAEELETSGQTYVHELDDTLVTKLLRGTDDSE